MATIVYKNAKVFIQDAQIDAQLTELSVEYKAEMLDATTYGNDTRIRKGGMLIGSISGKGFFDSAGGVNAIDSVLFTLNGADEGSQTSGLPVVLVVFPDGITEGTTTNFGYAMKGVLESMTFGGGVGTLLPISFAAQSRGVLA